MRILTVGDPHAVPEELADMAALRDLVISTATENKADYVLFLGDQHHTHAILHVEVMGFWRETFELLSANFKVICLVGNHDQPGHDRGSHAMLAYKDMRDVTIVDRPRVLPQIPGVLFVPYMHNEREFYEASLYGSPTMFCHQTFKDCLFENGCPCNEGVDSNLIPQKYVISGHIHKRQQVGKVQYVGAPRWRSLTDANEAERYIDVVDLDEQGVPTIIKSIPTGSTVRRIVALEDTPEAPQDLSQAFPVKDEVRVDVRGPTAFVNERAPLWKAQGAKVRTFKTDKRSAVVRESIGIDKAFGQFVQAFQAKHGTPRARLEQLIKERLSA